MAAPTGWKNAFSFGKRARLVAVLPGARAKYRVPDRRPSFYYVPGRRDRTIEDLILANINLRKGRREIVMMEGMSMSRSVAQSHRRSFESERVSPGVYRVWFDTDLPAGEYAFVDGEMDRVHAFGIDAGS